jgi:hypothetical protein
VLEFDPNNEKLEQATKQAWFAPGVGLVKFIFDTGKGVHIHMELAEYSSYAESFKAL